MNLKVEREREIIEKRGLFNEIIWDWMMNLWLILYGKVLIFFLFIYVVIDIFFYYYFFKKKNFDLVM